MMQHLRTRWRVFIHDCRGERNRPAGARPRPYRSFFFFFLTARSLFKVEWRNKFLWTPACRETHGRPRGAAGIAGQQLNWRTCCTAGSSRYATVTTKCAAQYHVTPCTLIQIFTSTEQLNEGSIINAATFPGVIIIPVITFMHGIYNYIPEKNHVPTVYSVAAVLYLQSVLHVMLFRPWNMFCTLTSALPANVCNVQYGCFLQFLNFALSQYISQVLFEWFWNGSSRPYYYRYHFCFHIPHALLWDLCIIIVIIILIWVWNLVANIEGGT